ncbi:MULTISPECIES: metal-sulfur cluster assembly factor [unclassified Schaalia]|uniref:metal-sulfur cluster assembly factor n=1 Tax=unclassified Schaalia TaxID=2691889 RepID=UPI001E380E3C|nr:MULTISPECIES: metal-sulfur cluster assembly factor [unclassified Schaalia]MCD4550364.1 metal-sulfur cluster assembly factor [Schaalia sp. lx-260]MCD4556931.1 metal-sulfur cluster assembly factor [Schaalia sp. lx-100]
MNNPMAQSEPVEQRFAPVESAATSDAQVRNIEGTDIIENGSVNGEDILEALRDVIDPELGINIVDLGLVYGVIVSPEDAITLDMTLTSAACPLTDVIERQAQMVLAIFSADVSINWVWMPAWGPDRITPDGRDQLRAIGFNV